ncbi:hypothetical protein QCA50_018175 [Cerrena zonata]|uniref:Elongation factor 1 alpha-like protein n=1 Tax=Cerrena zonata TaxID=2478898 RepID=A0AAW0FHS1_9APHY
MAPFNDDDLADYDNSAGEEEFNEDSLNDEEYDKLYETLPKLKELIASYNNSIDEMALKEALYYNYYELSDAIEELKSKFPKKKEDSTESKPLSKLQKLALERARMKQEKDNSNNPEEKPQRISKLASLAKSRAQKKPEEQVTDNKSLGILENLQVNPKGKDSSEKRVLARKPLEKIANLRKSNIKPVNSLNKKQDTKEHLEVNTNDEQGSSSIIEKPKKITPEAPIIVYDLSLDDKNVLKYPHNSISAFLFHQSENQNDQENHVPQNRNKLKRLAGSIFCPLTNIELNIENVKKAKSNFEEPSPDDKILNAQKTAFEEGMNDLKISDSNKKETDQKEKLPPKPTKPFKKINIENELSTNKAYSKAHKSFVVIGHVDAGKSTLMGRLLYDLGVVDAKTINKLMREAEKSGKGSFALAWVMDQTSEERSRGVTVDICATEFETNNTIFTAIDAPGHKDFVPQMIGGVTQADIALLVVDSINGEFEAGFAMDGQTKEHTLLCKNLGIEKICVAINKLDKEHWSEERFLDIQNQLKSFLVSDVGFDSENVSFIPISGLTGNNVVKADQSVKELGWYKGPTLIEYLEKVKISTSDLTKDPVSVVTAEEFGLAINDIYDISSSEFAVKGRILSGFIQPGETVEVSPTKEYLQVQSVKVRGQNVNIAVKGETTTISFKTNQLTNKSTDDISIGDLILKVGSLVASVNKLTARINLFNMNKPLLNF